MDYEAVEVLLTHAGSLLACLILGALMLLIEIGQAEDDPGEQAEALEEWERLEIMDQIIEQRSRL